MRFRPKLDLHQKAIVELLRTAGYSVFSTASVGNGFPDIVVGCAGHNVLFEIKSMASQKKAKPLTAREISFRQGWKGPCFTITTGQEALDILDKIRMGRL